MIINIFRLKNDALPTEYSWQEAVRIYVKQFGIFLSATVIGLLMFSTVIWIGSGSLLIRILKLTILFLTAVFVWRLGWEVWDARVAWAATKAAWKAAWLAGKAAWLAGKAKIPLWLAAWKTGKEATGKNWEIAQRSFSVWAVADTKFWNTFRIQYEALPPSLRTAWEAREAARKDWTAARKARVAIRATRAAERATEQVQGETWAAKVAWIVAALATWVARQAARAATKEVDRESWAYEVCLTNLPYGEVWVVRYANWESSDTKFWNTFRIQYQVLPMSLQTAWEAREAAKKDWTDWVAAARESKTTDSVKVRKHQSDEVC